MKRVILLLTLSASLVCSAASAQTNPCGVGIAHCAVLTWTDPTNTSWNVYRYTGACGGNIPFTKITATALVAIGYIDTGVTAGAVYCYTVTGILGGLESSFSNQFVVAIPPNNNAVTPTNASGIPH